MKHSLLLLLLPLAVSAITVPLRQVKRVQRASHVRRSSGQMIAITNTQDVLYVADVSIEGKTYSVQVDTGSSDLWVSSPNSVPGTQTPLTTNISYGIGYAYGPIATANVSFAGYNVPSQAYMAGLQVQNPIMSLNVTGIMGLSFNSLSAIDSTVTENGGNWGSNILYNIFAQNTSEPNLMSILLQRDRSLSDEGGNASATIPGELTIGEYAAMYQDIANTPHISTYPETNAKRWSVLMDKMIVNGKSVSVSSSVSGAPANKGVALLDSGTTLVYAPTAIVNAMYGDINGAEYSQELGQWIVPCDSEVDVSIVIAGRIFDVHPLDTVQTSSTDGQTCVGSWIPGDLGVGVDYILGDAALRSIYAVFSFGDYDSNNKMGNPYIQLWSMINGTDASNEFHRIRGGQSRDTFVSDSNSNSSASGADSSNISDLQSKVDKIYKWAPVALGIVAFNVLALFVVIIATIIGCRRNRRSAGPSGSFVPIPLGASSHDYRPVSLQETPKYAYND